MFAFSESQLPRTFQGQIHPMANKDIVSSIMAALREFHPELPEHARVNLELDLRRMESVPTTNVKEKETRPHSTTATRRPPTPRTDVSPRSEREPLGFAALGEGFNQRR